MYFFYLIIFSSLLSINLLIIKAHGCIHHIGDILLLSVVQHFIDFIIVIIIYDKGTSRPRILVLFDEM